MIVYVVFMPPSDPYAGDGTILGIYEDFDMAQAFISKENETISFDFEKLYIESFELIRKEINDGKEKTYDEI